MRQKYTIIHDAAKNNLKIKEYAVVDKSLKDTRTSALRDMDYLLMYEENYDGATIECSISKGMSDLVSTLRTPALFPVAPHAAKIAESVISLYGFPEDRSVELFFDDLG